MGSRTYQHVAGFQFWEKVNKKPISLTVKICDYQKKSFFNHFLKEYFSREELSCQRRNKKSGLSSYP
jgi:hypothetical protein